VDDDDFVSNALVLQFFAKVPNRRCDAAVFIASGYDD
jgi:hypothetical protein